MRRKNKIKLKILPIIIAIFSVVIIISIIILINILKQNYIVFENIKTSNDVTIEDLKKANILIANNVIIGGYYNGNWIEAKQMYDSLNGVDSIDIDMYSETLKYGTFKTSILKYNAKNNVFYTTTSKIPTPKTYIAFSKDEDILRTPYLQQTEEETIDKKNVKKALGKYKFLNSSVKILGVYHAYLEKNELGKIIVATSNTNRFGIYSAVIYVANNNVKLIKYAYVKNSNRSASWPLYDVSFVIDVDGDGMSEIILQETTETTSSYSIIQYIDGEFYQVLKQEMKI